MVKVFGIGSPSSVCFQNLALSIIFFTLGYLACLSTVPRYPISPPRAAKIVETADTTTPTALIFRPQASTPINHPGEQGQVSKVLKQVVLTGAEASVPTLVHLSLVDFGDGKTMVKFFISKCGYQGSFRKYQEASVGTRAWGFQHILTGRGSMKYFLFSADGVRWH